MGNRLAVVLSLALLGCTNGPLRTSAPQFRQLRVGDTWNFAPTFNVNRQTIRFEVAGAGSAQADGIRALILRVTERRWGRVQGGRRAWKVSTCDLPVRQAADGSLVWDDLQPEDWVRVDPIAREFPPFLRCPFTPGQVYDTGEQPHPQGTQRITWKVVGQEEVSVPVGRFRAWRVEGEQTYRKHDGKVNLRIQWTDWYDGDRFLLRRKSKIVETDDKLAGAIVTLGENQIVQVP